MTKALFNQLLIFFMLTLTNLINHLQILLSVSLIISNFNIFLKITMLKIIKHCKLFIINTITIYKKRKDEQHLKFYAVFKQLYRLSVFYQTLKNQLYKKLMIFYYIIKQKIQITVEKHILSVLAGQLLFTGFFEIDPAIHINGPMYVRFITELSKLIYTQAPLNEIQRFIQENGFEISLTSFKNLIITMAEMPNISADNKLALLTYVQDFIDPALGLVVNTLPKVPPIWSWLNQYFYAIVNEIYTFACDHPYITTSLTIITIFSVINYNYPFLPPVLSNQNIFVISIFIIIEFLLIFYLLKQLFFLLKRFYKKHYQKYY